MMIASPKAVAVRTCLDAWKVVSSRSCSVSFRPSSCCRSESRRTQFSTMMTLPSMMMPKSIAPSESRLALMPACTMPVAVSSIASGIAIAVMSAARRLPKQREEHDDHQDGPEEQVVLDGRDRLVDQAGAVEHGPDRNARGQRPADFLQLRPHVGGDLAAVAADEHERGADHRLLAVEAGRAVADLAADADGRDVGHADGHAVGLADHDPGDVLHAGQQAAGPHLQRLAGGLDVLGPLRDVAGLERVDQVGEGEPVAHQLHRVGLDAVLLLVAADRVHARDVGDLAQLRGDRVLLQGAQVRRLLDRSPQHLALGRQVAAVALPARGRPRRARPPRRRGSRTRRRT